MRDKIHLSDLTILYVCLSENWGTIERKCLSDASYFRNIGGVSFILCYKNSTLDRLANFEDIPRLYIHGDLAEWQNWLNFYYQLQQFFLKRQIDLVHTYSYSSIKAISLILKKMPRIPLIYTFNEQINSRRKIWLDRFLLTRTDLILTYNNELKELVKEIFPISDRKVEICGVGVDFARSRERKEQSSQKNKIYFFIPRNAEFDEHMNFVIESISSILQVISVKKIDQKIIFSFVTDVSWYEHPLYDSLKRVVLERHLELSLAFETKTLNKDSFTEALLYVGIPREEIFVDEDLFAFLSQVPMLLPRTNSRHQLLKDGLLGESYQPGDIREFRSKFLKILDLVNFYRMNYQAVSQEEQEVHEVENYLGFLYSIYENLCNKRIRFSQRKRFF